MSVTNKMYIFGGLILGLSFLLMKSKAGFVSNGQGEISSSTSELVNNKKANGLAIQNLTDKKQQSAQPNLIPTSKPTSLTTPTDNDYLQVARESSQKEKENFEKTAFIKIDWPTDFQFSRQDSDEGMIGVVGRKQNSDQIYGLVARQGISTNEEVEKFLPELAQRIPGVPSQLVNAKISPEKYDVEPNSPFKNVYTWQVQDEKNVLYLIKADRKDGLGSYMIFTTGPNKESQRTEKDLETMINRIQLTSP